jgi:hypothetical protein
MKRKKSFLTRAENELWNANAFFMGQLDPVQKEQLAALIEKHEFSPAAGDLILIDGRWYITHSGLLGLAWRNSCDGIRTEIVSEFCDSELNRWVVKATVFTTASCNGFTGFGDANPSNVSPAMHGAELRIAETRAVNRALRKAYGIGLCSVEELGSSPAPPSNGHSRKAPARLGANLEVITPTPLRDQLRQLIRQHRLDPILTKSYSLEHLGVKSLRDASRDQVSELIQHLQNRLFEDRDGLIADIAKLSASEQKEVA